MKFKRTYTAAQVDVQSKWDLIEAIAEDAVDADVPVSGTESCLAAKAALDAAGNEHRDETVKHLCVLAKFDSESTAKQRRIWRRYGWTVVYKVVSAGWSQEATYDLLIGEHKTVTQVMKAVGQSTASRAPGGPNPKTIDDRLRRWLGKVETLFAEGAALADEAENTPGLTLGAYGELALMIYDRLVQDKLDAEIRELMDTQV